MFRPHGAPFLYQKVILTWATRNADTCQKVFIPHCKLFLFFLGYCIYTEREITATLETIMKHKMKILSIIQKKKTTIIYWHLIYLPFYHLGTTQPSFPVNFQRGGGGKLDFQFLRIHWLSKCSNFFSIGSNCQSLKMAMYYGQNFHPADFWNFRPKFRPEISVGQKFSVFSALGDLAPPFNFWKNYLMKKNFIFF